MLNPAALNFLQTQAKVQQAQPQQQAPSSSPFDAGIARAIQSARASLSAKTEQQNQNSIIAGINSAANAMGQNPVPHRKGFWANFAGLGPALTAGSSGYMNADAAAQQQNEAEADKLLAYQMQEQQKQAQEAERDWQHGRFDKQLDLQERQFGETQRQHNMMDQYRRDSLAARQTPQMEAAQDPQKQELGKILDLAEREVVALGNEGHRNNFGRIAENFVPGGYRMNEGQSKINAIGDVLRGKLFSAWGYRNQAEFEHVPSISADNSPEANLAIIQQLKAMLTNGDQGVMPEAVVPGMPANDMIMMMDPDTGEQQPVAANLLEQAQGLGLVPVQ